MNATVLTYAALYAAFRIGDLCCVLLVPSVAVQDEKNQVKESFIGTRACYRYYYHNAVSHLKTHVIILNVCRKEVIPYFF